MDQRPACQIRGQGSIPFAGTPILWEKFFSFFQKFFFKDYVVLWTTKNDFWTVSNMYRHSKIANYLSTYCCPCSILTRPFEKHQKSRVIHKNLDLKQLLRTAAQCVLENILPSHILQVKIALRTTSDADDAANLTQLLHITM